MKCTHLFRKGKRRLDRDSQTFPDVDIPYSTVTPLPGIPLWQALGNPALILLYLTTCSQKELFSGSSEH